MNEKTNQNIKYNLKNRTEMRRRTIAIYKPKEKRKNKEIK